jgi:hypothetical protein
MSKSLLVLSKGSKVSVEKDGSKKEFFAEEVVESEGLVKLALKSKGSEVITLEFAQKTGKEYLNELKAALREFGEKAAGGIAEFALEVSSDLEKLGKTIGDLNLAKRIKSVFPKAEKKEK